MGGEGGLWAGGGVLKAGEEAYRRGRGSYKRERGAYRRGRGLIGGKRNKLRLTYRVIKIRFPFTAVYFS